MWLLFITSGWMVRISNLGLVGVWQMDVLLSGKQRENFFENVAFVVVE